MVLFTVKKVRVRNVIREAAGMPTLKFGIRFTILAIVVLAEPAERFAETASREPAEHFGVDSIMTLHGSGA